MLTYGPLFRLEVRHDYLNGGPVPVIVQPDEETVDLAQRGNLKLRPLPGRVDVYADDERDDLVDLAQDGKLTFTFRLRPHDGKLPAVTVGLADISGKTFVLDDDPALESGALVPETALADFKSGGLVETFDRLNAPLAIVRIRIDPLARDEVRIAHFGAAKRHWVYHLIGGMDEITYAIRDPEDAITFNAIEPRKLSNGRIARRFRSAAPIEVRANPPERFELLGDGPFGQRVILPVLPAAAPDSTSIDPAGDGLGADIFVNLA